jgi:hypothetical protein
MGTDNDTDRLIYHALCWFPKTDSDQLQKLIKIRKGFHRYCTLLEKPESRVMMRLSMPDSVGAQKKHNTLPVLLQPKPAPWWASAPCLRR